NRRRKFGEVDLLALDRVLQERGIFDHDGRARLQCLALLHPGLERVERAQCRIDAERERGPLRARGGIGEDAKAARKAFDGVEQKRRGVGSSCRHLGDGADLEAGICALDAPERAELVDECDEFAQVLVHSRSPLPRGAPTIAGGTAASTYFSAARIDSLNSANAVTGGGMFRPHPEERAYGSRAAIPNYRARVSKDEGGLMLRDASQRSGRAVIDRSRRCDAPQHEAERGHSAAFVGRGSSLFFAAPTAHKGQR